MISSTSLGAFSSVAGLKQPRQSTGASSASEPDANAGVQQARSRSTIGGTSTSLSSSPTAGSLQATPNSKLPRGSLLNLSV